MKISAKLKQIELFNGFYTKFGGHSQWMSKATGLNYLLISFQEWRIDLVEFYYDGWHTALFLGWIAISWGGKPIWEAEK